MDKRASQQEGRRRKSLRLGLESVIKRALAVAAGVSVLAGAVAAVRSLLPENDPPPPNVEVKLDPVDIRPGVPLDEFRAQETFLAGGADAGADAGRDLATNIPAPRPVPRPRAALSPDAARADVEDRCAERASPAPAPACAPMITAADENRAVPQLREQTETIVDRIEKEYAVGRACSGILTSTGCSLTVGATGTPLIQTPVGGAPAKAAEQSGRTTGHDEVQAARPPDPLLLKLALVRLALRQLRNTKSIAGPDGKRRPLGVLVEYRVRLCGFTGRRAQVFWSIFDTGRPPRLPYRWVHNRLGNVIRQRSTGCEEVSPTLWVPMPAVRGRFTIVLSVVDEDGNPRGRARTAPFRT